MSSLFGHVAIVTGVSPGGVGLATTIELCKMGATVVIACRDATKAARAMDAVRAAATTGTVTFIPCDLGSLASIRQFVTAFLARYTDLSLLVNNAGLNTYGMRGAQTTDGFEMAYGVNYIGHFYLTSLLLPILRASAPSRIINVASQMHRFGSLADLKDAPYKSTSRSYSNSKLAMIMHAYHLQTMFRDEGVDVRAYAVSPGGVKSEIWRGMPRCLKVPFDVVSSLVLLSPAQGAATTIFAATHPTLSGGVYISPYMGTTSHPGLFDMWSLYGGPRVCYSSPDSYSLKAGRVLYSDTAALIDAALHSGAQGPK